MSPTATILTRIYIDRNGDLIITDYWDELDDLVQLLSSEVDPQ